jgi:mono/diheme cytochrome c family protein
MGTLRRLAPVLLGVAVIAGAIFLGARQGKQEGNRGFGEDTTGQEPSQATPFTSDQEAVKGLSDKATFSHTCGTCHTLRAAGVTAGIGPDLDRIGKLTFAGVRQQIRSGSTDTLMPANLLIGKDANRVARYVARVSAGKPAGGG